jgi:hypothetical protein
MRGRVARMVNGLSPEQIIIGSTIAADAIYDLGESVRTGDSLRDASFGVAGNTIGGIAGLNVGTSLLAKYPAKSKFGLVVPVGTALVGNLVGGYLGDRLNEVIR